MLVSEIIERIRSKESKLKDIALELGVSDRTIQTKLKDLGYVWSRKDLSYNYAGDPPEPLGIDFRSLLGKSTGKAPDSSKIQKESLKKANTKVSTINHDSDNKSTSYDLIDVLLSNEKARTSNRIYRGFYFDSDILEILDRVSKGNKSDLINEALRRVFKEKGLL